MHTTDPLAEVSPSEKAAYNIRLSSITPAPGGSRLSYPSHVTVNTSLFSLDKGFHLSINSLTD